MTLDELCKVPVRAWSAIDITDHIQRFSVCPEKYVALEDYDALLTLARRYEAALELAKTQRDTFMGMVFVEERSDERKYRCNLAIDVILEGEVRT
jgi:hypothetical protein